MAKLWGGREKKRYETGAGHTTIGEYADFMLSGARLASTGKIGDVNARNIKGGTSLSWEGARENFDKAAARSSISDRDPNSRVYTASGDSYRAGDVMRVDQDQVDLLTSLYKQRLNDIVSRRARPGFKQVL